MNWILRISFLLLLVTQTSPSFAALGLTVSSVDGGNALRFGRIAADLQNKQQLRVRMSYQVFQRVIEPVVNEKGEALRLQAIETATVANTNAAGTIYLQTIDTLGMNEQLVYTSGQNGPSDSFDIAYSVRPDLMDVSGTLSGKLMFTVRPIGGGSQETVIVNIFMDAASAWSAQVTAGRTTGRVRVKDTDAAEKDADFVKISFSGNGSDEVRIYQEAPVYPRNDMGEELNPGVMTVTASGASSENIHLAEHAALAAERVLLYRSKKADDAFAVYFLPDGAQAMGQKAGAFVGKIQYVVETDQHREVFPVDLEYTVRPMFSVDAALPAEGVRFESILPTTPPVDKEVRVTVKTNLRKPYQVVQSLVSPMVNEKGQEIEKQYFTFKVVVADGQKGRSAFPEFVPVQTGEYPLFFSDSEGSESAFTVVYKLQGYPHINSGTYNAPVRFSLNQN